MAVSAVRIPSPKCLAFVVYDTNKYAEQFCNLFYYVCLGA